MIKPTKTAGLALLLGVVVLPSAQTQTPAENAAQEVVRRQAAIIELRNKLTEAKTVEQSGNTSAAAILYEAAQKQVETRTKEGRRRITPMAVEERAVAAGYVWVGSGGGRDAR